ncbi:MAG: hypothetical protein V4739_04140 [Pseudomonadota bacterium]
MNSLHCPFVRLATACGLLFLPWLSGAQTGDGTDRAILARRVGVAPQSTASLQ